MTFAVIDNKRDRLESLTHLLPDTFPGSVIYQQTNDSVLFFPHFYAAAAKIDSQRDPDRTHENVFNSH